MSVRLHAERSMSFEWPARSSSLAWSNPLAWWWSLLTLVSAINIAAWFSLYHYLQKPRTGDLVCRLLLEKKTDVPPRQGPTRTTHAAPPQASSPVPPQLGPSQASAAATHL